MYPVKRLLVGIDQSSTDNKLIKFCAGFAAVHPVDKIYIIHVAKNLELPETVVQKYPDLIAPVDENIIHETTLLTEKYFDETLRAKTEILVMEGNPANTILKEISIKEIDMLVMGKKTSPGNTGYLARKMALLAGCNVAIIADQKSFNHHFPLFEKVLVPVDFSGFSKRSIEMAGTFLEKNAAGNITCQYVLEVPAHYHYGDNSFREILQLMEENSKKEMDNLLKENNIPEKNIEQIFTTDTGQNVPLRIHETILEGHYDLVIMGSKGRTAAASVFLGSNAEKVIDYATCSIMVMKDKNHNLDLIDILLKS